MTPDQIKAIQESFSKVAPIADEAASLFYGRLFDLAPSIRIAAGHLLLLFREAE